MNHVLKAAPDQLGKLFRLQVLCRVPQLMEKIECFFKIRSRFKQFCIDIDSFCSIIICTVCGLIPFRHIKAQAQFQPGFIAV